MSSTIALLQHVVHGQSQRTILDDSKSTYLGKVRVMTDILNSDPNIRAKALVCTPESLQSNNPVALMHTGKAAKIYKLVLPIPEEVAQLLFAAAAQGTVDVTRVHK